MQRPLHLSTPREIRQSLAKIANETRRGDLSPSVCNALTACCNSILSALKSCDYERKILELEQKIEELEAMSK